MLGIHLNIASDEASGGGSWQTEAIERTARSIEDAMERELGRTDNWWLDAFRSRLHVVTMNVRLAQHGNQLEETKAAELMNRLRALQAEVETTWPEDSNFRVEQMQLAVRKLASIVVEIPLQ